MKSMKKLSLLAVVVMAIVLGAFAFTACNNIKNYTVTFDANGGSFAEGATVTAQVEAGGTVAEPSSPTRTGYVFDRWFTDQATTQRFEFTTPIGADMTIYAGWTRVIDATVRSISIVTPPTKTDYIVGEAFDSAGLSISVLYSDSTTRTLTEGFTTDAPETFTEAGTKTITVTYMTFTATVQVTVTAAQEPEPEVPTIESLTVTGEATKKSYFVGEAFDPTGLVVTAKKTDGTTEVKTLKTADNEDGYTITPPTFTTAGTNVSVTISYGGKTAAVLGITVRANVVETITVEGPTKKDYNVGDTLDLSGLVVKATNTKGDEVVVEKKVGTADGYVLTTSENIVNNVLTAVGTATLTVSYGGKTQNITLTVTDPEYAIAYEILGVNEGITLVHTNPATIKKSALPYTLIAPNAISGYTFKGWTNDSEPDEDFIPITQITADMITNNAVTLYALFMPESYTITYHFDSAVMSWKDGYELPTEYLFGEGATLPTQANITMAPDKVFTGWKLCDTNGQAAENATVIRDISATETGDIHVCAVILDGTAVAVTFNYNYGTTVQTPPENIVETTVSGQKFTSLLTPVRPGYTFNGWFTAATGGVQFTTETTVENNIEIFAQWEIITSTVTYPRSVPGCRIEVKKNDEATDSTTVGTITVTVEDKITFTFTVDKGYVVDMKLYPEANGTLGRADNVFTLEFVSDDIAVAVKCDKIVYNISYNINLDGAQNGNNPATFDIETAETLNDATMEGYRFDGWFLEDASGAATGEKITSLNFDFVAASASNGELKLIAKWTKIELSTIAVKTPPTKMNYYSYDTADLSGLVLTLTYTTDETEEVAYAEANAAAFTVTYTNGTAFSTGDTSFTIGYGGKTVVQTEITVTALAITNVALKDAVKKSEYFVDENADYSEDVFVVTYNNGTTTEVSGTETVDYTVTSDKDDASKFTEAGVDKPYVVTVTDTARGNISGTVTITVRVYNKPVVDAENAYLVGTITTDNNDKIWNKYEGNKMTKSSTQDEWFITVAVSAGDMFKVQSGAGTWFDAFQTEIKPAIGYRITESGDNYGNFYIINDCTIDVYFKPHDNNNIWVDYTPNVALEVENAKTYYYLGTEKFDTTGMSVYTVDGGGNKTLVTEYTVTNDALPESAGEHTVTITYTPAGGTARSIDVTVNVVLKPENFTYTVDNTGYVVGSLIREGVGKLTAADGTTVDFPTPPNYVFRLGADANSQVVTYVHYRDDERTFTYYVHYTYVSPVSSTDTIDFVAAVKLINVQDKTILVRYMPGEGITPTTFPDPAQAIKSISSMDGIQLVEPEPPTADGYTFTGWTRNNQLFDFDTLVNSDTYLFATWRPADATTYEVSFMRNDSNSDETVLSKTIVAENGHAIQPSSDPTRDGYTFKGWYKTRTGAEAWDFGTDTVTEATNIYAQWTAIEYVVAYQDATDSSFMSGTMPSTTYTYGSGSTTSVTAATWATGLHENYNFDGWYIDSGLGTAVTAIDDALALANATKVDDTWTIKLYPKTAYGAIQIKIIPASWGTSEVTFHTWGTGEVKAYTAPVNTPTVITINASFAVSNTNFCIWFYENKYDINAQKKSADKTFAEYDIVAGKSYTIDLNLIDGNSWSGDIFSAFSVVEGIE